MAIALALLPVAGRAGTQIERGQALFFDAAKGCAVCHSVKGRGTAVGPNLSTIARISVRALATAIRSTETQYVQTVKLKAGDSFPAMPDAKDKTQFWDLSKTPPELRKLDPAAIDSTKPNVDWRHPPAAYPNEQLADIVAFLRYTFAGDKSAVDPADVQ
jgi:cytochrome c551/c552